MAGEKLYEGTNTGSVTIRINIPADSIEEAKKIMRIIYQFGLPDMERPTTIPGGLITYEVNARDETFEIKEYGE